MAKLIVLAGPMYSGKTETLIKTISTAIKPHQVFKPRFDTRYSATRIVSHSGLSIPAIAVKRASDMIGKLDHSARMVGIDEIQFMDKDIVKVCETLLATDIDVVGAGLDLDFRGEPFGCMPALLSIADEIVELHAVCAVCGGVATRSQRLVSGRPAPYDSPIRLLGGIETYEPRCVRHHDVPGKPDPTRRTGEFARS